MRPHKLAGAVVVVDPHRQPVHPCLTGARLRTALMDTETAEPPVGIDGEIHAVGVDPRCPKPLPTPAGQVAPGRPLQRAEQITERRVTECVVAEVIPQPSQELLQPDIGDQLSQYAGTLGIGDPVKVHLDGGQVWDVGGPRMRRGQLILPVGPRFLGGGERGPCLGVLN